MVRSYRSRNEIVVDVLKATKGSAKKTHIMQRANLNPSLFEKYFAVLVKNGFIVKENDSKEGCVYKLSNEGKAMLKMYKALREKLDAKVKKDTRVL